MNEAALILGMAVVTYAIRYPAIAILGRFEFPDRFFNWLKFVPPAILTAIIVPSLLMPQGEINIELDNAYLVAGLIAGLAAWRTRNLLLVIVVGMLSFWLWRWLV